MFLDCLGIGQIKFSLLSVHTCERHRGIVSLEQAFGEIHLHVKNLLFLRKYLKWCALPHLISFVNYFTLIAHLLANFSEPIYNMDWTYRSVSNAVADAWYSIGRFSNDLQSTLWSPTFDGTVLLFGLHILCANAFNTFII